MSKATTIALTTTMVWALALACLPILAVQLDSRAAIERAVHHIDNDRYSLARSYLEVPLIDQRITITERSRAYYLQGYSFEQQFLFRSAAQEYTKALAFNPANPATLTALGYLNYKGLGVAKSHAEAARLLSAAAQLDYAPAMTGLGTLLLEGHGVEQNITAAREWLRRATEANHGPAYVVLGKSYRRDYVDPPNPVQAQGYFEKAMVLNQPEALLALGHMHLNGEFGETDATTAAQFFERASQRGVAQAQASLAYLYLQGQGVEKNHQRATELYEQAAQQGSAAAHYGLAYLNELHADLSSDAAARAATQSHYEYAARVGYAPAQLALSRAASDTGDLKRALHWLRQAAKQGTRRAYNRLAWLLATSPDDRLRNGTEAVEYALKAVEQQRTSATLDTLAAAYAEASQFDDAIATQTSAIEHLQAETLPEGAKSDIRVDYEHRLRGYQESLPWRDTPAPIPTQQ